MNISVLIYIYLSKLAILSLAHIYPNCVLESVCYISQQQQKQYFFLPLHNLLVDVSTTMTNITETQSKLKVKILVNLCKFNSANAKLLPISEFVLNEQFQWNASKFAIFYIHENPKLLFPFFISPYFIFFPNECPGLCRHRPGHSLGKKIK